MTLGIAFGKYQIIAELGHGGMADVFLGIVRGPVGSGFVKLAVVKRLRPNLAEDPEFITMLMDEARISARLNHPNVVQTLEVGSVDSEHFLAMEYLDGQPLHRIQKRALRLGAPLDRALEYVVLHDALAGLHHAHELADYDGQPLGIVHRDITPHNVLITYEGQVKVVDFGIAKASGRACETRQGIVKGKVRYMSPEQAMGQQIDRRADVFAVGILLWEAATGHRFWRDEDDLSIVQTLVSGEYERSPQAVEPSVSDALDAICRRALAPNPEDRFATAAELRDAMDDAIGEELAEARRRLGPKVAELFSKERAQLKSIIEQASRDSLAVTRYSSTAVAAAPGASTSIDRLEKSTIDSLAPVAGVSMSMRFSSSRPAATSDVSAPISSRPSTPAARASRPPRGKNDDPALRPEDLSLLGFIPRKKRFGAGLVFGAATMLCSVLVAMIALSAVVPAQGAGAGASAARSPRVVAGDRRIAVFYAATSHAPPSAPTATTPPAPAFVAAPSPPPRAITAPGPLAAADGASASASVSSTVRGRAAQPAYGPRSRTRVIDTQDPWGRGQ